MKGAEFKIKNRGIASIQDDEITDNVDSFYVLRIPGQFAVDVKNAVSEAQKYKEKTFRKPGMSDFNT